MYTPTNKQKDTIQLGDAEYAFKLSAYPIDIAPTHPENTLDAKGIPSSEDPARYRPTIIAQYALIHWNHYLATDEESHREAFLAQALWLVSHEERIGKDASGWPVSFPHPDVQTEGLWLSGLAQGNGISVLVRAYQLTQESAFLEVAHRAVRTFERDILDGGVSTPIGENGIFFEEVAVYPAAHMLSGFIFALFGLYDYVALTGDAQIEELISRSLRTMHVLLDEFDIGYWTRPDLLHRQLSSPAQLALQVVQLEALARYTSCEHCKTVALHWKSYLNRYSSRLRYWISSHYKFYRHILEHQIRTILFPKVSLSHCTHVCVPITGFPVTGGIRAVLAGMAQVMEDTWQIEYLTQHVGTDAEGFAIHRFGTAKMHPWQFPAVWLYVLAGFQKLISLLRYGANYDVILPQDGVFTAAFAALVGKLAGTRVVCIDHGNLTLLKRRSYRVERIQALKAKNWTHFRRLLARLQYLGYWPSLYLLARITARFVDHFLIPGVTGDGVEEACRSLGIPTSHITRFASMIAIDRYMILDATSKANMRQKHGIAVDAIVVTIVCRLAPEKGIDIALEAISQALSALSPALCKRVRVIIAGDGPLRKHIEEDIGRRGLSRTCVLWGEISPAYVISLLSFSDIFLYTSTRQACFSMAVLEAMASGCAVIASTEPLSNARLLTEGRGIAVPPGDAIQTSIALVRLLTDLDLCQQMGRLARGYIAVQHSATTFRQVLMRATYWSALDEILSPRTGSEK